MTFTGHSDEENDRQRQIVLNIKPDLPINTKQVYRDQQGSFVQWCHGDFSVFGPKLYWNDVN